MQHCNLQEAVSAKCGVIIWCNSEDYCNSLSKFRISTFFINNRNSIVIKLIWHVIVITYTTSTIIHFFFKPETLLELRHTTYVTVSIEFELGDRINDNAGDGGEMNKHIQPAGYTATAR